jgi:predicted enzyme related to lactoylglutathione lyase
MDPVIHFEMPYNDSTRMANFYTKAFGWQSQLLGAEMGNYVVVNTTETADGRPTTPGTINGGFYAKSADMPAQFPSVVVGVGDIAQAMKKVTDAGGTVLGEPMDIPGIGKYVSFLDTEGNRASMLQALPRT